MSDRENNPTPENVLDFYRNTPDNNPFFRAKKVDKSNNPNGAIVGVAGLSRCPWCDSEMKEIGDSMDAVCIRNPKHIVEWLPWGG